MFVTAEDFTVQPFTIPGISDASDAAGAFAPFVTKWEKIQYRELFGSLFYNAMVAGINALPADWVQTVTPDGYAVDATVIFDGAVWKSLSADNVAVVVEGANWTKIVDPLVDRWIALRDGAEYVIDKIPYQWGGMVELTVPMIYSLWVRYNARSLTVQGVVVSANENSELVSPATEICRGWNTYYELAMGKVRWRHGWSFWYNRSYDNQSLFGYLYANAAAFDDLVVGTNYVTFLAYIQDFFCSPGRMNEFDI